MPTAPLCLITGANAGIGRVTALDLARKGYDVLMLCRNLDKARPVQQEIQQAAPGRQIDFVQCDLADLNSVRKAADNVASRYDRLDVLINNAGLFLDTAQTSAQGYELTFATNHLGPFLLTTLLLPLLRNGEQKRIVNVSSEAHRIGGSFRVDELSKPGKHSGWKAYGLSKLCNILFSNELARRLADDGITSNALHPGAVNSNFGNGAGSLTGWLFSAMKPFFRSVEKGAETSIFLASSPAVQDVTGLYFADCKPKTPNADARNTFYAKRLWDVSEELVSGSLV